MQSLDAEEQNIDVLLINPPWISKDQNVWHGIKAAMPPLGLLSIAAQLRVEGYSVGIMDVHVERWTIEEFKTELARYRPRFVGISMMTATAIASNRLACLAKEIHPDTTVVVGGVHADAMPDECLKNRSIDIVVRGDGERTLCRIVAGDPWEGIRGISYRRENVAMHNLAAEVILDLDSLPMPAYDLVPMRKYYPAIGAYKRLPAINMLMTRGCPGKCTFCNSAETTLRTRSAARVFKEVKHLHHTYGIREIQFYDDTFTVFKQNVMEFCALMRDSGLGISWAAFVRTDCFSERLAKAMKEGGCHQVMFGIESGDDQILENIRKPIDRERTRWAVQVAKKAGLEVRATYMLGNPGETVETMQKTIDYALELDSDLALFNITTPYPGTQMFTWAQKHGYLNTEDWGEYELSGAIMTLPTVSPEKIQEVYALAHKLYYNRPIMFWRRLMKIRNIRQLIDGIHAFSYIILRRNFGNRDFTRHEWIGVLKESFWNVPLEASRSSLKLIRTGVMPKSELGVPASMEEAPQKSAAISLTVLPSSDSST